MWSLISKVAQEDGDSALRGQTLGACDTRIQLGVQRLSGTTPALGCRDARSHNFKMHTRCSMPQRQISQKTRN